MPNNERPSTEEVVEALNQINLAESLSCDEGDGNGDDKSQVTAMGLYQSSIEILLKVVRQGSNHNHSHNHNYNHKKSSQTNNLPFGLTTKDVVQLASDALGKAEALKRSIANRHKTTTPHKTKTKTQTQTRARKQAESRTVPSERRFLPRQRNPPHPTPNERFQLQSRQSKAKARPQAQAQDQPQWKQNPLYPVVANTMYVPSSSLPVASFDDLSGLHSLKRTLSRSVIDPLVSFSSSSMSEHEHEHEHEPKHHPNLYVGLRAPPSGILLYGPPGTGKTLAVRAVAYRCGSQAAFFRCGAAELVSKWHGEGEKLVSLLFQVARAVSPSILFFDEMDALFGRRTADHTHEASRRLTTEFLVQMDQTQHFHNQEHHDHPHDDHDHDNNRPGIGTQSRPQPKQRQRQRQRQRRVWVLGCTNTPWDLDDAVLRRMEVRVYVSLPDQDGRASVLRQLLRANPHNLDDRAIQWVAAQTEGYSGSDLRQLAREAAFASLDEHEHEHVHVQHEQPHTLLQPISLSAFQSALSTCGKSVSPDLLRKYIDWEHQNSNRNHTHTQNNPNPNRRRHTPHQGNTRLPTSTSTSTSTKPKTTTTTTTTTTKRILYKSIFQLLRSLFSSLANRGRLQNQSTG